MDQRSESLNELGMLGLKLTGLALGPDEAGVLGNRGLRLKPVDVADFGDDTGGVDLSNARNGGQANVKALADERAAPLPANS